MVWPANALCPSGNTISFINACTLAISLCSIVFKRVSSGGTASTFMLFILEKGGTLPFFMKAMHLLQTHTLPTESSIGKSEDTCGSFIAKR